MIYLPAIIVTLLLVLSLFLIFFSLPGTWAILIITTLWSFFFSPQGLGYGLLAILLILAVVGEVIEFAASYFGTKKFGGSNKGSIGGMVGALIGAISMAPILFGLGALVGALMGAFTGCFIVEFFRGVELVPAVRSAWGTTLGRFAGFIAKLGIGVTMLYYSLPAIWQGI